MLSKWQELLTSTGAELALDTFYGSRAQQSSSKYHAKFMTLGAGSCAFSGLVVDEFGYRTILRTNHASVIVTDNGWYSTRQIPLPVSAAVTQQWLRIKQLPLHAGLVSFQSRGLLIVGDSHAGKSTLSSAAKRVGAGVVSDDYIRVQSVNNDLVGHRIRGFLRERNEDGDQRYWLGPDYQSLKLDAVLILDTPRERSALTSFTPCTQLSLTMALIRHSAPLFMQGFEFEGAHMRSLIAQLTQLPALKLSTGTDVKRDPAEVLQRVINELGC